MSSLLDQSKPKSEGGLGETVKVIVQALVLALVVRTLFFQPFNIPSGSMKETLLVGDYLFVSKYSYGFDRFSLPFGEYLPDFGRIWSGEPKRGDIVVFRPPGHLNEDYIKRVIGLPGDHIQMRDQLLYINGVPVEKTANGTFVDDDDPFGRAVATTVYKETLPNGVVHHTLYSRPFPQADNTEEFVVPAGHYFMMGDNRDDSSDSRIEGSGVGFVPAENLVGKAQMIFFSLSGDDHPWEIWKWPRDLRISRLMSFPK